MKIRVAISGSGLPVCFDNNEAIRTVGLWSNSYQWLFLIDNVNLSGSDDLVRPRVITLISIVVNFVRKDRVYIIWFGNWGKSTGKIYLYIRVVPCVNSRIFKDNLVCLIILNVKPTEPVPVSTVRINCLYHRIGMTIDNDLIGLSQDIKILGSQ